jgi:L-arabinose isomerase
MEHLVDFAEIAQVELVRIDEDTTLRDLRHELAWTDGIRPLRGR